jgi:hypothetical protein
MPSARHYSHLQDHIDFAGAELANWLRNNEEALGDLGEDDETIELGYALRQWVEEGNGVEICGGDYTMLLRVALDIACSLDEESNERWHRIIGRRIVLGNGWLREIFSLEWWAYEVFQYHKRQHH